MAHIGTFTATKDGFDGTLHTLNLNVELKLVKNGNGSKKKASNTPDYHLRTADGVEVGAAWCKMTRAVEDGDGQSGKARRPYLSVSFDDPSLPGPIFARLVEAGNGSHALYWTRSPD
jgi:uncharacterized protein (DUF736 family)